MTKKSLMKPIDISTLSEREKRLLCSFINYYSSGNHPWADSITLPKFTVKFTMDLLTNITEHAKVSENVRDTIKSLYTKLFIKKDK